MIVAGVQSIYKRACDLDAFDLVMVDEAHLIPPEGEGVYRQFLADANGHLDATADAATIEAWWDARPDANVAIATAGLPVVDVDAESRWLREAPDQALELAAAPLAATAFTSGAATPTAPTIRPTSRPTASTSPRPSSGTSNTPSSPATTGWARVWSGPGSRGRGGS